MEPLKTSLHIFSEITTVGALNPPLPARESALALGGPDPSIFTCHD